MRASTALGAAVLAAAQALLGCGRTQSTAGSPAAGRDERLAVASGAFETEAIDVDSFARRIDPSLVPLATVDHPSRGPAQAPVTIRIFSDFECPFCARAVPVMREVEAEFGGRVRTVWFHFPLPGHPHAELAAVAGVLVYRARGGVAFWRFHDALFDVADSGLSASVIERLASREGVAPATLRAALATGANGKVAADFAAGDAAGVRGTPAFLVNDRMVTGVMPYPEFRALVAKALSEAK